MTKNNEPTATITVSSAVTVPASVGPVIAEGHARLDAIADEIAAISELIGLGAGQHMLVVNCNQDLDEDRIDGFFAETGWEALATKAQNLGESLVAATGYKTDFSLPEWAEELAKSWRRAALAFEPDSDHAATIRRQEANRERFDRITAGVE